MNQLYEVVIVEDDPMVAMLDRAYVEKDRRFHVAQEFHNGREALPYLTQSPPDLIVLDVYMPLFTGLDLLRELRGREVGSDVIMVTAANDTATLDALLKLGVTDYLVKPFTQERFQQALDTFCLQRHTIGERDSVSQTDIDRLLFSAPKTEPTPKGVQESTLALLRGCLRAVPAATSEELSARSGLSTVTVRRYMNYLMERGEVEGEANYDTGGRPSINYHFSTAP